MKDKEAPLVRHRDRLYDGARACAETREFVIGTLYGTALAVVLYALVAAAYMVLR